MHWKKREEGKLLSFSNNQIDIELSLDGYSKFRMTGFYGEPQCSLRHSSWTLMRQLSAAFTLPWCLVGNLNNILQ